MMNLPADRPRYVTLAAAKLRQRPAAIIAQALETLARWRAQGQSAPQRLDAWEQLLREAQTGGTVGVEALLHVMESDEAPHVRLCEFHPFAGALTREERRAARQSCAYKH